MQHLTSGTTLQNGKYRIERVLGQGGFGITYLAENTMLEGKVAIKEFFFKDYCDRNESAGNVTITSTANRELVERFKQKFIKEARNIFKLNHPNIVRILDIFEENGTAYYVMEYAEGGSLADRVKREGYLSEPVATRYILQVAEALDYIHQRKMNHLDIKPANIMLNEKDECVLIDFGLSKQYDAITGSQTSTTPVGISEGYAPMEQYMQGGVSEFSPETDIYALGATFFKLLTGKMPPSASDVNEYGVPVDEMRDKGVSDKTITLICKAMEVRRRDRMNNLCAFKETIRNKEYLYTNINANNSNFESLYTIDNETETTLVSGTHIKPEDSALPFSVKGVSFNMIKVEPGTFTMCDKTDLIKRGRQIIFEKPFYIGETQVTQNLWETVMGNNPSHFKGHNLPVECVNWKAIQSFVSKLNALTKKKFRLPTEAEWEFAARGGNSSKGYEYSGSDNIDDVAWHFMNSNGHTHTVATKMPNELGIYDMSGNVEEFCDDWYVNHLGRVVRGGSWNSMEGCGSLNVSSYAHPDYGTYVIGFRIALDE